MRKLTTSGKKSAGWVPCPKVVVNIDEVSEGREVQCSNTHCHLLACAKHRMTLSLNLKALGGFVPIYNTQAS
jgi:hypothetical protein